MVKDEQIDKYLGVSEDEINKVFYLDFIRLNKDKILNKIQWYELLYQTIKSRWFIFCNSN